jgi:predicted transcriptional regulator/N-acetylglutamate synthase-like GNAT family acetyltransferase
MPPRLTLDTVCGLNLHTGEPEPDPALLQAINLGLNWRVQLSVTPTALEEVQRATDPELRRLNLARIGIFPVIRLEAHQAPERERLRDELMLILFTNSEVGSTTWEHNRRDCEHIAAHILAGGDYFVTLDGELLKKADKARDKFAVRLLNPTDALSEILGRLGPSPASPPGLAIRQYEAGDEPAVRTVLAALADDYPDFDTWLTKQFRDENTAITVGLVADRVAAVAIWKRRESERVIKLGAFRVDEGARQNGLGPHLLWHLIRTWVGLDTDLVYVTLSSRHAELVSFFASHGFLVSGVTPERYHAGAAEIVMGKHLLRREVTDEDFGQFATDLAERFFGVPASEGGGSPGPDSWFLAPTTVRPTAKADVERGSIELLGPTGEVLRAFDAVELERVFHPLRLLLSSRRPLMVPIRPDWADRMMRYPSTAVASPQLGLFSDLLPDRVLLRTDNAYYCTPRREELLALGVPMIFYVSQPVSACVAEARVLDYAIDTPERLLARYGDLGVYSLDNIRTHVHGTGRYAGCALGLHFGLYVPFERPVTLSELRQIRHTKGPQPQGLSSIDLPTYQAIREAGGLRW